MVVRADATERAVFGAPPRGPFIEALTGAGADRPRDAAGPPTSVELFTGFADLATAFVDAFDLTKVAESVPLRKTWGDACRAKTRGVNSRLYSAGIVAETCAFAPGSLATGADRVRRDVGSCEAVLCTRGATPAAGAPFWLVNLTGVGDTRDAPLAPYDSSLLGSTCLPPRAPGDFDRAAAFVLVVGSRNGWGRRLSAFLATGSLSLTGIGLGDTDSPTGEVTLDPPLEVDDLRRGDRALASAAPSGPMYTGLGDLRGEVTT